MNNGDDFPTNQEQLRLDEDMRREKNWKRWGPYLSARQWGTVREDYSATGDAWNYFPHDQARQRAYRWGEDGLLGITDRECRLCFALALWNGRDPILKERPFGLTNAQGNHGEDVKECYYYLDSTPTHSYMKALYKYPHAAYPYEQLVLENARRSKTEPEFELEDTGIFDESHYFDIFAEYAKGAPDDLLIRITVANRGPENASMHLLPTLWFRNTWGWAKACEQKPQIKPLTASSLLATDKALGEFELRFEQTAPFLFTENDTNFQEIFNTKSPSPYVKDAFHRFVVSGDQSAVNPDSIGTKAAAHYQLEIPAGESVTLKLRLLPKESTNAFGAEFDGTFAKRIEEADAFYAAKICPTLTDEQRAISRQAYAGLLWSRQYYNYVVKEWLEGDEPPPPPEHAKTRNENWKHVYSNDVISMPDNWEYPWFASWDLAFHMVAMAEIDAEFAKNQLLLLLREWYMRPNGQIPAYEWNFSDVNPPVHAWACWRVFQMTGGSDRLFLERAFQKLMLNFTWWVNRKDVEGNNIFGGGFLGLDNIGLFDRSKPLPNGEELDQADGTAWMASFCSLMLTMALELAVKDVAYEDIASKFFNHFVDIVDAINTLGGCGLWDEHDGFYYDHLIVNGNSTPLQIRSLVGLLPLIVVLVADKKNLDRFPDFRKRVDWFLNNRKDLHRYISYLEPNEKDGGEPRRMLALSTRDRLERLLRYMLDENEFLSPYGLRSLSRFYKDNPYSLTVNDSQYQIDYEPAESSTNLFGGNSNWRGPVWFPINYLIVEALLRYHEFYGDSFTIECPTGSGKQMTLDKVAQELASRLTRIFTRDANGRRSFYGDEKFYADDPHWRDLILFNEYFHGETGRGLGADHQTGWTALVTRCFEIAAMSERARK